MWNRRQIIWASVLLPIVVVLAVVAAWAIDTGASSGQVLRNVTLARDDISRLGADELVERIEGLNSTLADRKVIIDAGEVTYETTAAEIGLSVDTVRTANAALDEGRTAMLPVRPFGWLLSFASHHDATIHYMMDAERARSTLLKLEGSARVSPVEPTLRSLDGEEFQVVPGKPGTGIDPVELSEELTEAALHTELDRPLEVDITPSDVLPRLNRDAAEDAAARANALTSETIRVTGANRSMDLVPRELRTLATPVENEETIRLALDPDRTLALLNEEFGDLTTEAKSASFVVEGGVPKIIPSTTGRSCCDESHVLAVEQAMQTGQTDLALDLNVQKPDLTTEEAKQLGIVEEVGSPNAFGPTTEHACCQNRVHNIHRIADIVRGVVIKPGETFSVNGYVGQRTVDKGFAADGVIYNGELTQDVGGGVSQFATTLFNAALYAGLDFGTYQSHSLYISRYPRGHEATISYPNPDLEIVNDSEYGVLIWPTYTDTSITVHLYSTRHIDVSIGEPTSAPSGNCTRWTTPRTRTYPDGRTGHDTVSARYRPAAGVNC